MNDEYEQITVMIPTYNRKEYLLKLLEALKHQSCQRFKIVISDNCSNYDINKTVSEYKDFFNDRLKLVIRNNNVGSTVNINGVFDITDTKWGWLLGDDDFPIENAIETIYSFLDENISALHFSLYDLGNFIGEYTDIKSISEFIDLFWKMSQGKKEVVNLQGDLIFMSNKVYDLDIMRKYLFEQNTYGYTRVPQMVSILKMLEHNDGQFRIVQKKLVNVSDSANQSWKMTNIALGISTFSHIDFNISPGQRKKLNLIIMFKYTHVLRYRLQGEISRYNIGLIYDGIYKRSLSFKDRVIFNVVMRIAPSGIIAKKLVDYKNRHIRLPK